MRQSPSARRRRPGGPTAHSALPAPARADAVLEAVLAGLSDAVVALDQNGCVTDWGPGAEVRFGRTAPEMLGQPFRFGSVIPLADTPLGIAETIADAKGWVRDARFRLKDGTWFDAVVRTTPIRGSDGRLAGCVAVITDRSDRRRTDQHRAFLADASRLLATSLNEQDIVDTLVRLAVPSLGDWCVVDRFDEDKRLRRVAVAGANPAMEPLAREFVAAYPPDADSERGLGPVVRDGTTTWMPEISDQFLRRTSADPRAYAMLRRFGVRSCVLAPLIARDEILGALSLVSASRERAYRADDRALIEDLGRRVALALVNARLYRSEQRARERAETLQAVTASMVGRHTALEGAERAVKLAMATIGADRGALGVLDDRGDFSVLQIGGYPLEEAAVRAELRQWDRFPRSRGGTWEAAVRGGEPIFYEAGVERLADSAVVQATIQTLGLEASATLPLVVEGHSFGVLWCGFTGPHRFPDAERGFLRAVADQCAQALEQARLRDAEQRAQRRAHALAEAAEEFAATSLSLPSLWEAVVRRASQVLGDGSVVSAPAEHGEGMEAVAFYHPDPEAREFSRALFAAAPTDLPSYPSSRVMSTGRPLVIPELVPEDLRPLLRPEHATYLARFGVGSLAMVPMRVRDKVLGVLGIWRNRTGRPYTDDDVQLLQDLANAAAIAWENGRLYAQAEAAVRLRDEFLSLAAHELKTPVAGLRLTTQLLLRTTDDPSRWSPDFLAPRLTTIDRQSRRLARLVDQLLDVTRLEAGRLPVTLAVTDLAALARDVVAAAQAHSERHQLTVEAPGSVEAAVDRDRLEQVLVNLVDNAIKYSPDGGPVQVSVWRPGTADVAIAVTDHGLGIAPDHRPYIFDRIYQAHANGYLGGMGRGLYIARQIVELHGHNLSAEFPDDGGTRFIVRLPAEPGTRP